MDIIDLIQMGREQLKKVNHLNLTKITFLN
jgi:hypothetical protein